MTEPLTPAECDLRGYEFVPLFGQRLFGSKFYGLALRNPRAGLAAIKLWWEAWQQCPAASLPDDDYDLARMADFGSDLKGWAAVRDIALHGFVKCSDGRLYHSILSSEAITAWERRKKDRARKAEQRAKRGGTSGGNPHDVPRDKPRDSGGTDGVTAAGQGEGQDAAVRPDRTGQDRTEKKERAVLRTDAAGASSPDPRQRLWDEGVPFLRSVTGMPDGATRGFLGKSLRDMGDDCAGLLAILAECQDAAPLEPKAWLVAAVKARTAPKLTRAQEQNLRMAELTGRAQPRMLQ